ncbi:MAG: ribonuclease HII, partial [Coriobacteriales bacterium]|nr:ribonuclease HII [Coriobacteriales bacterium]
MYEEQRLAGSDAVVIGIDEVGRGSVAGPLTVCAVCLPLDPVIEGLDDSKKLTPKRREVLAAQIRDVATAIGTAHIPPADIDKDGMSACLHRAMG